MNMKEKLKNFFTLARRADGGFTLIELIVTVAIIAILGGVGVPAYSGYVEKTNIAADQSLAGEVKKALALAYYANPNGVQGVVVLSPNAAPDCGGNAVLEEALTKVFGEGWENGENLKLKHDGWSATFQGSNYYSDTEGLAELMGTVEGLTDALGAALAEEAISSALTNGNFAAYVQNLGAETEKAKADAAVFYVADTTGNISAKELQNAVVAMQAAGTADDALKAMNGYLGSTLASTAALYALAEGYANYYDANYETTEGQDSPNDILAATTAGFVNEDGSSAIKSASDAYNMLMAGFNQMGQVDGTALNEYMTNHMASDINAYAETMKMVSASKDSILANNGTLGSDNYFSTDYVKNMVSAYSEGCVLVYILEDSGQVKVTSSIDESE